MELPKEAFGPIATISGAVVGFLGALVGFLLVARAQSKLEDKKTASARKDAVYKEQIKQLNQLATDLGSALHSMGWITWAATQDGLDKELLTNYNQEIHSASPKLIADHAMLLSCLSG
jgi:hypothetical protein